MISLTGLNRIKAFTLVELLLVCMIGGIFLGMVIPQVRGSLARLEIRDSSRDLASLIKYAQAKSIVDEVPHRLNLALSEGRYWLTYQKDPLSEGVQYERLKTSIGRIHRFPRDMKFDSLTFNNPNLPQQDYISFYPDGGVDEATIAISNEEDKFTITITGRIAQVRIEEKIDEDSP